MIKQERQNGLGRRIDQKVSKRYARCRNGETERCKGTKELLLLVGHEGVFKRALEMIADLKRKYIYS